VGISLASGAGLVRLGSCLTLQEAVLKKRAASPQCLGGERGRAALRLMFQQTIDQAGSGQEEKRVPSSGSRARAFLLGERVKWDDAGWPPEGGGLGPRPGPAAGGPVPSLSKAHITAIEGFGSVNVGDSWRDPMGPGPFVVVREGSNTVFLRESVGAYRARVGGRGARGDRPRVGGGLRGKIKEFSSGSRRRFLRRLAGIDQVAMEAAGYGRRLFLTLTYPAGFPTARASKVHLEELRRRLLAKYPAIIMAWKIEPQKRDAPHYHPLVWLQRPGCSDEHQEGRWLRKGFRPWLQATWSEVIGSDQLVRTSADWVRSRNGTMRYAGKYVGKVIEVGEGSDGETWCNPGRFWGIVNPGLLAAFEGGRSYVLDRATWLRLRRVYRGRAPDRVRRSAAARGSGTWWTFERGMREDQGFSAWSIFDWLLADRQRGRWPPIGDPFSGHI